MDDISKALVGKTIKSFTLAEDGDHITFHCDEGDITLGTEGDCCSQTWIESIDTPKNLKGKVLSAEEIEVPDLGNVDGKRHTGVDQVSYYGLKVVTSKGHSVIDYRNDSNGYYGGNLYVWSTP